MIKKNILFYLLVFLTTLLVAQENNIVDVKVKGLKKTKISVIEKFLLTKEGSVLDSIVLNDDVKRLKKLPAISHAYYQVFKAHFTSFDKN